jgi:hypothetical protein
MGDDKFPVAIALLGLACIIGFMAFRPWPAPTNKPIKPGAYFIEILQGNPPAASKAPDRAGEINVIQDGLMAITTIWALAQAANMLSKLGSYFTPAGSPAGGSGGEEGGAEEESPPGGDDGGLEDIFKDAEGVAEEVPEG